MYLAALREFQALLKYEALPNISSCVKYMVAVPWLNTIEDDHVFPQHVALQQECKKNELYTMQLTEEGTNLEGVTESTKPHI